MSPNYLKQVAPFVVPTTDGKVIEEHYGAASSRDTGFSVAHMIAPPGWSEPPQRPDFDETTIVIRGRKKVEVDGEEIVLGAGESVLVRKGARVRYSNPFEEETEYWAICVPAFTFEKAHRE
ncbi:MAG: cupin domain-containing protein [Candidatus Hydrogenedentota bacterium]